MNPSATSSVSPSSFDTFSTVIFLVINWNSFSTNDRDRQNPAPPVPKAKGIYEFQVNSQTYQMLLTDSFL